MLQTSLFPLFLIALLYQKKEKKSNGLKCAMVFLTVDNFFAETGYMAIFMDIQLLYEALFPRNRSIPYFRNGTGRLFGRLIHFLSGKWSFTDKLSTGAIFRKKYFSLFFTKDQEFLIAFGCSISSPDISQLNCFQVIGFTSFLFLGQLYLPLYRSSLL